MEALEKLKELNVEFKLVEHEAVYTMEEIDNLGKDFFEGAKSCKNLLNFDICLKSSTLNLLALAQINLLLHLQTPSFHLFLTCQYL